MNPVPPAADRAEGPSTEHGLVAPTEVVARALGEPARFRLFRALVDHDGPMDVAGLATELDAHPNALRRHLHRLVEAGLVTESTVAGEGRGRPRHLFTPVRGAADPWLGTRRYEELARLLGEAVRTGATPREVGHRAGLRATVEGNEVGDPTAHVVDALGHWGFAPHAARHDDQLTVTLLACPYGEAVEAEAAVICALHLGLAEGLAEASGGLTVERLEVRPPSERVCRLHMRIENDEPTGTL